MAAPKREPENTRLDYEPVPQWGPDGVDEYLIERGESGLQIREGESQPDPFRHLDEPYSPRHETSDSGPDPFRHFGKSGNRPSGT
jgi:hypothetical protein